ncbi:MAG: DUF393 domain-containing protein [Anaerolineales bacterium]|nr:DUF393 domain-containing protein [Anaerolineales bacterium]MCB9126901.1 DUF393 domain-containing protein [Ardenticatenales bacterium]MCB9171445.1 DUF393 domain-containing protein [Ardenticatenales bacterium]
MRLVKMLDWRGRLEVAPNQEEAARIRAGLNETEAAEAAWLLLPNGTRYRGMSAIWAALAVALPVVGDLGLAIYHLPLMRPLQDRGYDWIAANRSKLTQLLRLPPDGE